jgi:hypothetical protein
MFDRVKPSLLNFLHTMFGMKMTSSFIPVVLPPTSEPVVTYIQRLAAMKKGDGIMQLKKFRVTHARAYKSKAPSQHEYVSATVVDPENKTSFIAFERLRGDPEYINASDINTDPIIDPNTDPSRLGLFSTSNSSVSSVSSVLDSTSAHFTNDRVAPIPPPGKWDKKDEIIRELKFEKPLFLYELAILAVIVHEMNKSYLLMTNNCYHYAGTIMDVLEKAYDAMKTAESSDAGKWCGLALYPGENGGNTSSLFEKFREEIGKFVSSSVK